MNDTAIEIQGLTKRFGSLTAVDSLDLTVPTGQIMAFLGPNGAGKSTTTEMILGLQKPDAGSIRAFGTDPIAAVRRGDVGAMLQNGALLAESNVRSVLRVMSGIHAHPMPMGEVIERAGIDDVLKTPCGKLSGGQAQRVRFALAIMGNPRLLILDEPTVALDVSLRRRFWEQMEDLRSDGRTVMFATHYLDEADEYAERIVVIADGRLVADGDSTSIKQTVGGKHVTFRGDERDYATLPGVVSSDSSGDLRRLVCADSDEALRALLQFSDVHDVDVIAPKLEDAFVALTDQEAA